MMFNLTLGALSVASVPFILSRVNETFIIKNTKRVMLLCILMACTYAICQHETIGYTLAVLEYSHITLNLAVQIDELAKIMMIFILVIGYLIYHYAQNYLESDVNRLRFLTTLNTVLISVLLLVMAANLLTAFIAWQFIGVSLYLLLNHYNQNPAANRAAKKKFVINRIGDCSFLFAITLAYQSNCAESFASITSSLNAQMICLLLFVSVMTKCAQFPFHIWLMDTMETPTPVSALMHAGVINAGGILLTRVSGALVHSQQLAYLIVTIGLMSAVLSVQWMNNQPDIKKKLAYSTMGQMGYMLVQCGLGAFPAAIFHLMAHGFYKASLFLNAGEALIPQPITKLKKMHNLSILRAMCIALCIIYSTKMVIVGQAVYLPLLVYGFITLTVATLIVNVESMTESCWQTRCVAYACIALSVMVYFYCFTAFTTLLPQYEYVSTLSSTTQGMIVFALCSLQYLSWRKGCRGRLQRVMSRDGTEKIIRRFLLNPLRALGNIVNRRNFQSIIAYCYIGLMTLAGLIFFYALSYQSLGHDMHGALYAILTFVSLFIGVGSLILANRCKTIKSLLLYLTLFELAFTNVALLDSNPDIVRIGMFHLINMSSVLFMLLKLSKQHTSLQVINARSGSFPFGVSYLLFSLLLLIGIPGTASFISDFYLLNALVSSNMIFIMMYMGLIMLTAVVVMHSLQLYVFNNENKKILIEPLVVRDHIIFIVIVTFNLVNGIFPQLLLTLLK